MSAGTPCLREKREAGKRGEIEQRFLGSRCRQRAVVATYSGGCDWAANTRLQSQKLTYRSSVQPLDQHTPRTLQVLATNPRKYFFRALRAKKCAFLSPSHPSPLAVISCLSPRPPDSLFSPCNAACGRNQT